MSDQFLVDWRIRILTIVDAFSLGSPAIHVCHTFRSSDVKATLGRLTRVHGTPRTIRVDNGPQFNCKPLHMWAHLNDVTLDSHGRANPRTILPRGTSLSPKRRRAGAP